MRTLSVDLRFFGGGFAAFFVFCSHTQRESRLDTYRVRAYALRPPVHSRLSVLYARERERDSLHCLCFSQERRRGLASVRPRARGPVWTCKRVKASRERGFGQNRGLQQEAWALLRKDDSRLNTRDLACFEDGLARSRSLSLSLSLFG